MLQEIYGKKIGMTQIFDDEGNRIGVTLVEVPPVRLLEEVNHPRKRCARIGVFALTEKRGAKLSKPVLGYFNKLEVSPYTFIREVEMEADATFPPSVVSQPDTQVSQNGEGPDALADAAVSEDTQQNETSAAPVSQEEATTDEQPQAQEEVDQTPAEVKDPFLVGVEMFQEGDVVTVSAKSKGKGFAGGMKRHGWRGQPRSHGSTMHRRVGSIGASAYPSRVIKGIHMPGHMGNVQRTIKNLKIIKVDVAQQLVFIEGSFPGSRGTMVKIKKVK